jgi:hypothetical protein
VNAPSRTHRRVDFVQRGGRVSQYGATVRGKAYAGAVALKDRHAQRRLQRGDLAGHRGLRIAQGGRGGGERATFGHLSKHPHTGHRQIHDYYAYHMCRTVVSVMPQAA